MDHLLLKAFADSIINKPQTPIDVYDTATWMAITVLSEGSQLVKEVLRWRSLTTNGKWINRSDKITGLTH